MPQVFPIAFEGQSPDEFGRPATRIGTLTINLAEARELEEIEIGGNFLWGISATSNGKLCTVQFQDYTSAQIPYGQGQFLAGVPYSRLYLSNEAQPGESITFLYGVEGADGLRIENPLQDAGNVNVADPGTNDVFSTNAHFTLTASVASNIMAADVGRREAIIQAHPDNTENIYIGDSSVSDSNGYVLTPGQSLVITSSDAIHAYAVGADQKVIYGGTFV